MAEEPYLEKIQELSDLEIAVLLCLLNGEHCIINTDADRAEDVTQELRLIAANIFGLSHSVINFTPYTTLEDLSASILTELAQPRDQASPRHRHDSYFGPLPNFRSISSTSPLPAAESAIPNVVLAKNLGLAPKEVQIQVLELLRTGRLFTHTDVHPIPKPFVLIAIAGGNEGTHLTEHLNNIMFISHYHDLEDEYPNLAEFIDDDASSTQSVVRHPPDILRPSDTPRITADDLALLRSKAEQVVVTVDVTRYLMDIIGFLRLHRAVLGGITPIATRHCEKLIRSLAPLQGLSFVTPGLVGVAVRKVYPHRILIVSPEMERSVQWGSNIDAVAKVLEGIGPEEVIDEVLELVEVPA